MNQVQVVVKVCMLAGKIMLKSGAETYRVEDTMNRIAASFNLTAVQSYATPTGINFATDSAQATNFMRISNRSTDLQKITDVNHISRRITNGELSASQAFTLLEQVDDKSLYFPPWMQVVAAAFVSGSFTIMFGGMWVDYVPSFLTGGIGFWSMLLCAKLVETRFVAEFFASFMIGLLAVLFIKIGIGTNLDKVIIGAVMPLVPGLHITNAVRDLLAGHLVAGVSKSVEAILTAFAIGAGVAIMFVFV